MIKGGVFFLYMTLHDREIYYHTRVLLFIPKKENLNHTCMAHLVIVSDLT